MKIEGNVIDIPNRNIFSGELTVREGVIVAIKTTGKSYSKYILPGFVDAHVHIESSMLVPSQFARLAVLHGTVATVSDPHEIANVMGIEGVKYMIDDGNRSPLKFFFGAPSCVPATDFETAGAKIDPDGIREILTMPGVKYLAEMMNYPGVIADDPEVAEKLEIAKSLGKPIDGHAPGVRGDNLEKYIAAGISTDHESSVYEEGLEKLNLGMRLLIREGSAAKNFEALIGLLPEFSDRIMFCSDDKHPDDLLNGHINQLVARALAKGFDLFDILRAACLNPVEHYGLEVGQMKIGDHADFIISKDVAQFDQITTYIDGQKVAEAGSSFVETVAAPVINSFYARELEEEDFHITPAGESIRVVQAVDGEIVTQSFEAPVKIENKLAVSCVDSDILKFTVVNRYDQSPPSLAFIHGFGLKHGAIASCVGHDSHNIIAVGVDDYSIQSVVNEVMKNKGGIAAGGSGIIESLPLPVGGIMTNGDAYEVADLYQQIDQFTKAELGCSLQAPFMTLSFMALLVIPTLKLGDKGLFDGTRFQFTDLFVDPVT